MADVSLEWRVLALVGLAAGALALDLRKPVGERHRWREYLFLLVGASIGGLLGMLIDLVTSTLSPAYFEYGKGIAPGPGFRRRVLQLGLQAGATFGVLSSAVLLFANRHSSEALRLLRFVGWPIGASVVGAVVFGLAQATFGVLSVPGDLSFLSSDVARSFTIVWATHGGVYFGAVVGTIVAVRFVRR